MKLIATVLALCAAVPAALAQQPSRGELLYSNHCIECHTTQMHWRDRHVARDMPTLQAQVRRWQGQIGLQWTDEDIDAVAQHLNRTIYKFPQAQARR